MDPEEVEAARRLLEARTFRAEYEASFDSPTGRVFPDFSEENITEEAAEDGYDSLAIGMDFNVATLPAIVCSIAGDQLWVIDEVTLHNSTTEQQGQAIRAKNPGRHLIASPGPTGGAKKT